MMASFFWLLGRTLQFLALVQVGYALYLGLSTGDSRREVTILSAGAVEFLVGYFLTRVTGHKA